MRVRSLLARERLPAGFEQAPLLAQCSSLGSLSEIWLREFTRSFSAAGGYGPQPQAPRHGPSQGAGGSQQGAQAQGQGGARSRPSQEAAPPGGGLPLGQLHIVWPAVEEVQNSLEGWRGGSGIPGTMKTVGRPHLRPLYSR
jgi:hypothetical protein